MKKASHASLLAQSLLAFYRFAPRRLAVVFALMVLQGVTAGIGLLFLLPLLRLMGLDVGSGMDTRVAEGFFQVLHALSLPLNLGSLLLYYVLIIAAIATLNYGVTVMTARLQQQYICHLRNGLYGRLLRSRWQFIMRRKMSDFVHSLGSQVQSMGMAAQQMLSLLSRLFPLAAMTVVAFLLSWRMSLLVVALAGLLSAALIPFNRRMYETGKSQLLNLRAVFQMLTEQLASLKMIKSYGSEPRYARQLESAGESLESNIIRYARMNALTQWIYTVAAVAAFAVFFYTAMKVFTMPLSNLVLLMFIFSRILPQVSALQKSYQNLLGQLPAFEDVQRISLDCEAAEEPLSDRHEPPPRLADRIVLSNVSYRYPEGGRDVLSGFSAIIKRNHTVSLVGPSGAGKSTLADLIAGLLEPGAGKIFCDGVELEGARRIAWRRSLAYVTQEVYLFNDTVRANLNWVAGDMPDQALWDALKSAAADEFVARLPLGLDTVIGDRGVRLSGGERQRLALARALLGSPQLLILDEATSALDSENETRIHQALERLRGKLTIVIIAHRETTLRHADECIRLEAAPA
jgi:ATP-binding cassette subfamily C protein